MSIPGSCFSALLKLPDETLLQIMQSLAYKELHAIRRVCRRLRILSEDRTLDSTLFRGRVPALKGQYDKVESNDLRHQYTMPHPVFNNIWLWCTNFEDMRILDEDGRPGNNKLVDAPCWKQLAFNPPIRFTYCLICRGIGVYIVNANGIMVEDVVKVITRVIKILEQRLLSQIPRSHLPETNIRLSFLKLFLWPGYSVEAINDFKVQGIENQVNNFLREIGARSHCLTD